MERRATGVVRPCAGKMRRGLGLAVWPPPGSCRPGPAQVFGARRRRDRTSRRGSGPEVVRRVPLSLASINANTLPGAVGSVLASPVAVAVGGVLQPVRDCRAGCVVVANGHVSQAGKACMASWRNRVPGRPGTSIAGPRMRSRYWPRRQTLNFDQGETCSDFTVTLLALRKSCRKSAEEGRCDDSTEGTVESEECAGILP